MVIVSESVLFDLNAWNMTACKLPSSLYPFHRTASLQGMVCLDRFSTHTSFLDSKRCLDVDSTEHFPNLKPVSLCLEFSSLE